MKETPAPFSVSATISAGRRARRREARERRARARATSLPVAARRRPSRRPRTFASRSPRSDTSRDPGVGLDLVVVDDDGDLVQAAVRGGLQRLPELALLQLAVAGEDVDAAAAAGQPVGEDEAACALEMPIPSEPVFVTHLRRGCDVRMARAGRPAAAGGGSGRSRSRPSADQHGVEPGRVVALGGEVAVARAEHLEVKPGQDVDAAEARAEVARAGAP